MRPKRIHRRIERTASEKVRILALRSRFQSERPAPQQLIASGEYSEPMPIGQYVEIQRALQELKRQREQSKLSLADVSKRSGIDRAAISRLENGLQPNPKLDTLCRYAAAIGKQIVWSFREIKSRQRRA